MTYTSAQAAKLLRRLNDEYAAMLEREALSREFNAAVGENVDAVRPAYSYADAKAAQRELEEKFESSSTPSTSSTPPMSSPSSASPSTKCSSTSRS